MRSNGELVKPEMRSARAVNPSPRRLSPVSATRATAASVAAHATRLVLRSATGAKLMLYMFCAQDP